MSIWGAIGGIGGSLIDKMFGDSAAEDQYQYQRKIMKNQIQWRVDDAKWAGVHPVYALGANVQAPPPVSVGGTNFGAAGQDLGRAMEAQFSPGQRATAFTKSVQALQLQNMALNNELLSAQISRVKQAGNPPAVAGPGERFLIDGQGSAVAAPGAALIQNNPLERVTPNPGSPHSEPGAVTDVGWARTAAGGLMPVPSLDVKERIEDNVFQEGAHVLRTIGPSLMHDTRYAPPVRPRDGHIWVFNPVHGWLEVPATGTPESSLEYQRQ